MNYIKVYILALLIILQSFSKVWLVISFKINQGYIAQTFCIKKEIKNNGCQGKCYLKKQLEKAEQAEKKTLPTSQKDTPEVVYYYQLVSIYSSPFVHNNDRVLPAKYKREFLTSDFINRIFHPPKCILS